MDITKKVDTFNNYSRTFNAINKQLEERKFLQDASTKYENFEKWAKKCSTSTPYIVDRPTTNTVNTTVVTEYGPLYHGVKTYGLHMFEYELRGFINSYKNGLPEKIFVHLHGLEKTTDKRTELTFNGFVREADGTFVKVQSDKDHEEINYPNLLDDFNNQFCDIANTLDTDPDKDLFI